jgi:peptidoglycan/xylan/chitin deacetylase (PgdA/CDA1 family)
MKLLVLIFININFFLLSSCVSPQVNQLENRGIAQENTPEDLEQIFQTHWNSKNIDFESYIDRLVSIFYRAHKYSLDFDQELALRIKNKAPQADIEPMTQSEVYKKLYVMKLLTYSTHEKITYIYARLLEEAYNPTATKESKARAHGMMANLFAAIRTNWTQKPLGRLAMIDLFKEIQAVHADFISQRPDIKLNPTHVTALRFLNKDPESYYGEFARARKSLNELAIQESQTVDEEFESLLKTTEFTIDREPQQAQLIAPSESTKGNINGSQFSKGTWALTYDDGPSGVQTPKILDMLKTNGVKATFFWLAKNVPSNQKIVSRANSEGHDLANHSYAHNDLSRKSSNLTKEIVTSNLELKQAYGGVAPRFFRCPYGSCIFSKTASSQTARRLIAEQNMIHVLWNVDSNDWKSDTPDVIYRRTRDQVNNLSRGIILFHDIHERSYLASGLLVKEILQGKRMVRVKDAVDEVNGQ